MLERFENDPAPLAGSGHQWIASSGRSAERNHNADVVASLPLRIEEEGCPSGLEGLLRDVLDPAFRLSTDDTSPGYMAYVPAGGLFHSAVADLIGTALNRYVTINEAAPALAAVEEECVQWLCTHVAGYGDGGADGDADGGHSLRSGGVLTAGGSMANLVAIHNARRQAIGNAQLPDATMYVSEQAHYCVAQAGRFVGLQPKHIRAVPSCPRTLKMDTDALRSMVDDDLQGGLVPIAVCATAGTTNTGTCDDVEACAAVCSEFGGVYLHADAAYGGAFALTTEGRRALGPLELADSVVVDPHKGLFMPYGLGALLVKDQSKLLRANHEDGACMQPPAFFEGPGADPIVDMMNLSPEVCEAKSYVGVVRLSVGPCIVCPLAVCFVCCSSIISSHLISSLNSYLLSLFCFHCFNHPFHVLHHLFLKADAGLSRPPHVASHETARCKAIS